jgi:hypothetical protein
LFGKTNNCQDAKDKDIDAVECYALKRNRDNVANAMMVVLTDASDSFDQLGEAARKKH